MGLAWRRRCDRYHRESGSPGQEVVTHANEKRTLGVKKGKIVIIKKRTWYENASEAVRLRFAPEHVTKVMGGSGRENISVKAPYFSKVSRLSVLRWEQFHDG